ncbi:uncharacterized protein LOC134418210 isoform X2 [Melospiza melodia melodia]|uniref:uncharacterized protein LOC134418210 isoform X2 n=1 Tax=Melospiza melodia melodia TaxID=1914991 RepID=UPI002FD756C3
MGSLSASAVSSLDRVSGLQLPRGVRGRAGGRLRYPISELERNRLSNISTLIILWFCNVSLSEPGAPLNPLRRIAFNCSLTRMLLFSQEQPFPQLNHRSPRQTGADKNEERPSCPGCRPSPFPPGSGPSRPGVRPGSSAVTPGRGQGPPQRLRVPWGPEADSSLDFRARREFGKRGRSEGPALRSAAGSEPIGRWQHRVLGDSATCGTSLLSDVYAMPAPRQAREKKKCEVQRGLSAEPDTPRASAGP